MSDLGNQITEMNKSILRSIKIGQKKNMKALQVRDFQWFLTGTTLTNAAHWIQQVTLNWLVYDLTSSGALLGSLNLVRSLATVGLAPLAGVTIDRLSRCKMLYAVNTWLFTISLAFGLILVGSPTAVWPLFLFSLLGGIGQAFSQPLRQTVVFAVVPRKLAESAVALVQTGWALTRSVGPAIGGFIILWLGPSGNFFIQALAYALVTFTIYRLQMPYEKMGLGKTGKRGNFQEGWNFIKTDPALLSFLMLSWLLPLFIIPNFNALPPIYAKDVYKGGPDTLGLLLSAIGIGGSIGGLVTAALGQMKRRGVLQLGSLLLLSLSLIAFALSTQLWMGYIGLALAGFFEMIYLTTNMTLLQLSIPSDLRGRVMGILSLRSGLMPVGAFMAGLGADLVGPKTTTIILGGIVGVVAVVVYFLSPTVRRYQLPEDYQNQEFIPTSTSG